jgi:hypothetical protein
MTGLTGGRANLEIIILRQRFTGVASYAVAIEQHKLLNARLLPKAFNHLRNESTVVVQHLMFQCSANQLAFGESIGTGAIEKAIEMALRIDVRSHRTSDDYRRRNP